MRLRIVLLVALHFLGLRFSKKDNRVIVFLERMAQKALSMRGFHSMYFDSPVANLHYLESSGVGALAPFVFLHGISASAVSFAPLLLPMQRFSRQVIAVDTPGHGFSSVPYAALVPEVMFEGIRSLLDRLIAEPVFLYGNSLGGAMALRYALERPERVKGMILSSPAGAPMSYESFLQLRQHFKIENKQDAEHFLSLLYHKVPWYRPLIDRLLLQLFKRSHIREFFASFTEENYNQLAFSSEELASLRTPILLLWGQDERLLPRECLTHYQQHLPSHAIVETPERWGHSPHIEFAGSIIRRIRQFATDVSRA